MIGIQFIINERGEKTAVQIDLRKHRELWEDFQDVLISKARRRGPKERHAQVRRRVLARLNGNG